MITVPQNYKNFVSCGLLIWPIMVMGDMKRRLDGCSDLVYYSPADTYTASQMVNYGHYLSNTEFCRSDEYYDKVLVTPIVLCSLLTFMLLCFFGGMFGRMFHDIFKCRPPREDKDEFHKQKTLNSTLFYIACFLVLILDQLVFIGNHQVDVAVRTLDGSSGSMTDITQEMQSGGEDLVDLVSPITAQQEAAAASCATNNSQLLAYLDGNVTQYTTYSNEYTDAIDPVQAFLSDVEGSIEKYGVLYRQSALYFIWALAVLVCFVLLAYKHYRFRYGMKQGMWFGVCTYMLYVALCLPWTLATSAMADFCQEPSYNAVKSMPTADSLQSIGAYFSTCTGNCTLTLSLQEVRAAVVNLNESVAILLREDCSGNADLLQLQSTLTTAAYSVDSVAATMACAPIQSIWFQFWNEGVCDELYEGAFFIWGSQILTSLFLFVLIVCVSITYQFYGQPTAPYPLLGGSKVLPMPGLEGGERQDTGQHSSKEGESGFGDMEPAQSQRAPRGLAAIGRVLSFNSDMSEELNSSFF